MTSRSNGPGHDLVEQQLGCVPEQLASNAAPGSPQDLLASLIRRAATQVDDLHEQFSDKAQWASDDLARAAQRRSAVLMGSGGVLQRSAQQIDILAARWNDAEHRLKDLITVWKKLTGDQEETAPTPTQTAAPSRVRRSTPASTTPATPPATRRRR